ncbi:MAG: 50S ribosomal protein L10 [Desulfobacca sp.]|nr:50S ribosomal protein L10 [Desulfobacca sp.]
MLRSEKSGVVEALHEKLQRAEFNVLTDFKGLKVAEITILRREIKEAGGELIVVKNTLLKRAAAATNSARLEEFFSGPTAVALGYDNPLNLAKVLTKFAKDKPDLKLKAGVLGSSVLAEADIGALAKLPSREVLLGQLLAAMQGIPTSLVNVLSGIVRQLLNVLKAIEAQKTAPGD